MKKKLASVLYNMNYELATYSRANQLVESPALTLIVGVAKRAVVMLRALRYSKLPIIQYSECASSWADGYVARLKVYHSWYWYIQRYLWLSHS